MWKRFAKQLRCPVSGSALELRPFEQSTAEISDEHRQLAGRLGLDDEQLAGRVDSGLLIAREAGLMYPIFNGLPILLRFRTDVHDEFAERYAKNLAEIDCKADFPDLQPEPGEAFVMKSFSKEWLEYDYDGVIWEMDYADHEKRFLSELGGQVSRRSDGPFLEIGCGLGLVTEMGQRNLGCDAVGVDLSFAAMRASLRYRDNPFLHFAQASVFHLPFPESTFGVLYSHGVLHHTFSTEMAFRAAASMVGPGGLCYVWVYGPGSQAATPLRRILYGLEAPLRPILSRAPHPMIANIVLYPFALA